MASYQTRKIIQFGEYVFPSEPVSLSMPVVPIIQEQPIVGQSGSYDLMGFCDNQYEAFDVSGIFQENLARFGKPCNRNVFWKWLKQQFGKKDKLWAIDTDGTLMWAWARVSTQNFDTQRTPTGKIFDLDLSFRVFSGVWTIANTDNVFFVNDRTNTGCPVNPWNKMIACKK